MRLRTGVRFPPPPLSLFTVNRIHRGSAPGSLRPRSDSPTAPPFEAAQIGRFRGPSAPSSDSALDSNPAGIEDADDLAGRVSKLVAQTVRQPGLGRQEEARSLKQSLDLVSVHAPLVQRSVSAPGRPPVMAGRMRSPEIGRRLPATDPLCIRFTVKSESGGGGNRTPVRRRIDERIYVRSLCFVVTALAPAGRISRGQPAFGLGPRPAGADGGPARSMAPQPALRAQTGEASRPN
jgi:hypothetical protein